MQHRFFLGFVAISALTVAGCGGGGSTSSVPAAAGAAPVTAPAGATRVMQISYSGVATLGAARRTQGLVGTPVTASYNGNVVATGTLDANGSATLTFTSDVPRGATLNVVAGSVKATIVLAGSDDGTAVAVMVKPDGTLTVTTHAEHPGASPAPSPSPGATDSSGQSGENETIDEDHDGNPTTVTTSTGGFPANLPVSVTATCGNITIAPAKGALAHVKIELKVQDGDDEGKDGFKFDGALTSALVVPVPAGSLRLRIRIFAQDGSALLDVKGPITATTTGTLAAPCPSAIPSASASASASPAPVASASPSASPVASASPSPVASATPSASPSPSPGTSVSLRP
ncbi:MAG: hypothetical protein NVS2B17_27600 [Candidatus Velthaea sp.]